MKLYLRRLTLILSLALLLTGSLLGESVHASEHEDIKIRRPEPRITIPGLQFSSEADLEDAVVNAKDNATGRTIIYVPFIGEYIAAVYRYAVAVASIIAVIMIIIAGFQWTVSGGSTDTISTAKKRISNAIVGLILALGSYTLLYTINPQLVRFDALKVYYTQTVTLNEILDGGDTGLPDPVNFNDFKKLIKDQELNILCPSTPENPGNKDLIREVALSFKGNVTYILRIPGSSTANKVCPGGTACLDCSGFVKKVYQCATGKIIVDGTVNLFTKPKAIEINEIDKEVAGKKIKVRDIDYVNNKVNGEELQIGDLLGWKKGEGGANFGHVVMYIGEGQVIDANGNSKNTNVNPIIHEFKTFEISKTYTKIRWFLPRKNLIGE